MKNHCHDCCSAEVINKAACACCEGVEIVTPLSHYNRPGLAEINYRIGTHSDFLETMIARLTGYYIEKTDGKGNLSRIYPLQDLTTRNLNDPSIALLDAWASVADVLTFYQERIANEGYLRTATERRSILEMARLVGYKPRPGVSASVFLAYTLDDNFSEQVSISAGSQVQSIPGPDESAQVFETSEDLIARTQWNNLKPRLSQPQTETSIRNAVQDSNISGPRLYLKGISSNLKVNDSLLIQFANKLPEFARVIDVFPDIENERTLLTFAFEQTSSALAREPMPGRATADATSRASAASTPALMIARDVSLINQLIVNPSVQPANKLKLKRKLTHQFSAKSDTGYQTVASFKPQLKQILGLATANAVIDEDVENEIKVYQLKLKASLFGHNIPRRTIINTIPRVNAGLVGDGGDWPIIVEAPDGNLSHEQQTVIYLNAAYDEVKAGSWMVIRTPATRLTTNQTMVVKTANVDASQTRAKYGVSAATTRIDIDFSDGPHRRWINIEDNIKQPSDEMSGDDFNVLRATTIFAQPEQLELAEEPINSAVCGGDDETGLVELDGFYEGLESGRWVIVSGEREIEGTRGVRFSELAMLSAVEQKATAQAKRRSGDKIHTFIKLAKALKYCFKRDTVTIYGNVVKANHGGTVDEILGAGNGAQSFQAFELKQFPLTHVSASNPRGIDSTLKLFVNDIEWHETETLATLSPNDRRFITQTDNEEKTTVIFGNGKKGARLPTGQENIRAQYRSGIGQPGNVKAEQISLLLSKPLGVKEVLNPLRASAGADRESRDQARQHVPLAVKALDRLVSIQDYQDFSRIYAGIGKAYAIELSNGRQQVVHVTIAGVNDIPIDENSDLFRNLYQSLVDFGDPYQAVKLAIRELMFIVIEAQVAILPDYQWEPVVTKIREQLLHSFSFEKRELGQDVVLSEVISVMQSVEGVAYVDVDTFGGIMEKKAASILEQQIFGDNRRLLMPEEITETVLKMIQPADDTSTLLLQRLAVNLAAFDGKYIRPAQLAFLSPDVPETLILNQIK